MLQKTQPQIRRNARQVMDGLDLLRELGTRCASAVFLDPQYRQGLDALDYGNEGERQSGRAELPQMNDAQIAAFIVEIQRVLRSSAHLFLWVDKYALVSASWQRWMPEIGPLSPLDAFIWDKERIGMGRRSRSRFEAMIVIQKGPRRAEGIWKNRSLPDVVRAKANRTRHPHAKPIPFLQSLIECVTEPGDIVVDPCAGGYGVLDACKASSRTFIGCDLI
ncbi:MAG: DNA methyltransferase [Xanthobacteraceae bacterium]|nr:DNA methyltransferase [Xanthobacteraceae bacterium]